MANEQMGMSLVQRCKQMDMSRVKKYFDVEQLYGNSYSYVGLNIDGPDEAINEKIKEMQEREFMRYTSYLFATNRKFMTNVTIDRL